MTTYKDMLAVADEMAAALKKLTDGLAKDGVALDGFTDAIAVQHKWSQIKLKKMFEVFCAQSNIKTKEDKDL